ncbi:MAG: Ig-like domain-containing protein, partial [Chloroflexota bacterium]|nr:Ig-like domain-containing protein [Chloroflexota bacterium]
MKMNKRLFLSVLLFCAFFTLMFTIQAPKAMAGPHPVAGAITQSDGTTKPLVDDLSYSAYIIGRPAEVLTNESPGCKYDGTNWGVDVGNFSTEWSVGEVLHVEFFDNGALEGKVVEVTLTSAGADIENVQLEPLAPDALAITPVDPDVTVPNTQQFTATATYSGIGDRNVTTKVTWNSSDEDKGTIDAAGLFSSNHVGTTDITAEQGDVTSNTSTVTVLVGPANAIAYLSGDAQTKTVGMALDNPFVVKVTDEKGNPVSDTAVTFAVTAGGG